MPQVDADDAILAQCRAAEPRALLALYADLLTEAPEATSTPALALRDRARAGQLSDDFIPVLTVALVDAPSQATFVHLAKALAAFGRAATSAVPFLVERIDAMNITDDEAFWVFDSTLWCLGYLGGDVARRFIDTLAQEKPPRVQRSRTVYRGALDDDERQEIFDESLEGVRALLDAEAPGGWRQKNTDNVLSAPAPPPAKLSPWMVR